MNKVHRLLHKSFLKATAIKRSGWWFMAGLLRANLDSTIFPYDCSMRLAHVTSTTQIVSSKSDVQHLHDSCTQHKKCHRILKHVLKPYDSHSHNQNVKMLELAMTYFNTNSVRLRMNSIDSLSPSYK